MIGVNCLLSLHYDFHLCEFSKMASSVTENSHHPNQFCTTIGITSAQIPLFFTMRGFDDLCEMQKKTLLYLAWHVLSVFSVFF